MKQLFEDRYNDELSPIIKWPGGKESEIKYIIPNSPASFVNYFEPFVGGGSVFTSFNANHFYINDKSRELISLYRCIAGQDRDFFRYLRLMIASWDRMLDFVSKHRDFVEAYVNFRKYPLPEEEMRAVLERRIADHSEELRAVLPPEFTWHIAVYEKELNVNVIRKILRMTKIEKSKKEMPESDIFDNIETAFLSALYMYLRELYNDRELAIGIPPLATALFVFIRCYSYSGMFRYNKDGRFNVPYGGIGYNHNSLLKKYNYYLSPELLEHFSKTTITDLDFEDFFELHKPAKDDFLFLDPPYDSEFSTYAKNEFSRGDQERLADYLINRCAARWMMIIKNTDFIHSLYSNANLTIKTFDKTYSVSFMNRNDRNAEHLIIMNY